LASVMDGAASDELAALVTDLELQRSRVTTLSSALKSALAKDRGEDEGRHAAVRAAQVASIRQNLKARSDAAISLVVGIEKLAAAFAELNAINAKIVAALPPGTSQLPADVLVNFGDLKAAVAEQLLKAGHGPLDAQG